MLVRLTATRGYRLSTGLFQPLGSMRQVVLREPGPSNSLKMETIEDVELPSTLANQNDIRVHVAACAVAYRDIIDRTGERDTGN